MRTSFDDWLAKSPYHWYRRTGLSVSDRKIVDMMRAAYRAGTQSDELDRAAELLRRGRHICSLSGDTTLHLDIDAFLREVEG